MKQLTVPNRIINVSNRLPVKLSGTGDELTFNTSEGGLATGLNSLLTAYESLWIGWPGAVVKETKKQEVTEYLTARALHPVFLSQEEIDKFYEGFSNETLWPLFHYFPSYSIYREEYWEAYVRANQKFADAVIRVAQPDDIIWIHDYQLLLVPAMIRKILPDVRIGYFQHIPFPDFEIFRALPWRSELINGMLGADIIGFQTKEDARYFIHTAGKIVGKTFTDDTILAGNRTITVKSFPISIDYGKFQSLAAHENTRLNVQRIKNIIKTKIALSVDRLDYSKGIIQRLKAFDLFLSRYKMWHQKITLIHIIVPSRDTVSNYKELKLEMDQLISAINGKYACLGWQPIHHYYQSFDPYMLSAFYQCADMAIVTPLRDGMNLVSKEYIAGNINKNGVLLLGEAAGAAHELHDAILLNPNDSDEFARKIYEGLNISNDEKHKRMTRMQQIIAEADIFKWANSFISKLLSIVTDRSKKKKNPLVLPLNTHNNMAI